MKTHLDNLFGRFEYESSDLPLFKYERSPYEVQDKTLLREKTIEVGGNKGVIEIYKVVIRSVASTFTSESFYIEITAFEETKTYNVIQEEDLIEKVSLAEKLLLQILEKGKQPTVLDKLDEMGYKK